MSRLSQVAEPFGGPRGSPLTAITEAYAFSERYTQDRGLLSLSEAGTHFASHLHSELVASIEKKYEHHPERFHFSYLRMPDHLRESGSFDTNWMLQNRIEVVHGVENVSISGQEMVEVLRALHAPVPARNLASDGCKVLVWSRQDSGHQQAWLNLATALGGSDTPPNCPTN